MPRSIFNESRLRGEEHTVQARAAHGLASGGFAPGAWDAALVAAADLPDPAAFDSACRRIEWSRRSAADYVHATRLALWAAAHLTARELSREGHERFPEHAELAKLARGLGPARVISTEGETTPETAESVSWVRRHWREHHGRWVALRGGELVGTGSSLGEIRSELGSLGGLFVTRC